MDCSAICVVDHELSRIKHGSHLKTSYPELSKWGAHCMNGPDLANIVRSQKRTVPSPVCGQITNLMITESDKTS